MCGGLLAGVKGVTLRVEQLGDGRIRAYADLSVEVYPFRSVDVEVVLLVDGSPVARRSATVSYYQAPTCPATVEFDVELGYGAHVLEARARHRDPETMYPDDFLQSLRPREWYGTTFYPTVYVVCSGSTASPKKITRQDLFLNSIREWLWYYHWTYLNVVSWEEVPAGAYGALKSVTWEGRLVYDIGRDATTEDIEAELAGFMRRYWELEDSTCQVCVEGVTTTIPTG
jgi:hypothetical protein